MLFHTCLIEASHNQALAEINRFLADWLRYLRSESFKDPHAGERGLRDHEEILRGLRLGDGDLAAGKMKEHLERAKARLVAGMAVIDGSRRDA